MGPETLPLRPDLEKLCSALTAVRLDNWDWDRDMDMALLTSLMARGGEGSRSSLRAEAPELLALEGSTWRGPMRMLTR